VKVALVITIISIPVLPFTAIPSLLEAVAWEPFPALLAMTYGRPSSPETLVPKFFPRRKMRLPRGRYAPKNLWLRVLHGVAAHP
jgi:hypothetical protein